MASPDHLLRQGILRLLAIKDSDVRMLTLEQCRDAVDKGLHGGRRVLGGDPAGVAVLRRLPRSGRSRSDAARSRPVRAQQGARGGAAGRDLRRTRVFQPGRAARLAFLQQHFERPSGTGAAGHASRHGSEWGKVC